jgi:putative flippase GtrA
MQGAPGADHAGAQGLRFLASGAANTVITYALYCVLVFFLHPQVAYAIVFALGIAIAYVVNSRYVFRAPLRMFTAAFYPLVYAVQYALSALLIALLTQAEMGPRVALAIAIALVTPVSFVLNRFALARKRSTRGSA